MSLLRPHPADAQLAQLAYVVVNEAGASVYSTSQVGRDELPDLDATFRSGISIGRRLQDPLAELVKIEPQNIGVGLYQHDVNPKQLKETLESVIASCVNFVGVDLNTASVPLLRHVSGLNQLTARRIVDYRKEHGPFTSPRPVDAGRGSRAGDVHPGGWILEDSGRRASARPDLDSSRVLSGRDQASGEAGAGPGGRARQGRPARAQREAGQGRSGRALARAGSGRVHASRHHRGPGAPERDPREDLPKPIFKKGILKIEDLAAGMELKGTVLNVVDFGAFVDIGLKDSGLVHISQLANRYVKSPHDVVSVGDVVTVWVMGVDHERKRVSLTMVKPGTERLRAQQGGGGRRGPGEPREGDRDSRGQGQGRRGGRSGNCGRTTSAATGCLGPDVAARAARPRWPCLPRPQRTGALTAIAAGRRQAAAGRGLRIGDQARGPIRARRDTAEDPRGTDTALIPVLRDEAALRGPYPGQGPGDRSRQDRGPGPRPPGRPMRPSPPPPPLSKDALAGNVPLRTFGQLKQLWEAKVEPKGRRRRAPQERRPSQCPRGKHGSVEAPTVAGAAVRHGQQYVCRSRGN